MVHHRFQFRCDDFPTARAAFVIQPFCAAQILSAGGMKDTHKGVSAVPALDFPRQPCMGGFPGGLDFHVVHQLLAAGKPNVGGDDTLMGSQYQHLVFQVVLFAGLYIPPLIKITPVLSRKVSSVIGNDCSLTFEKFVHIKVCCT